jgi:hypothetical protein
VSVIKLFLVSAIETDIIHEIQKKLNIFVIGRHDRTLKIRFIVSVAYNSDTKNRFSKIKEITELRFRPVSPM